MGLRPPRRFQTAKSGNRQEECEDATWSSYPYNGGPARIAVCDGASESAFAREWAQILSDAFVHRPLDLSCLDAPSLAVWLSPCQEGWNRVVPWERIPWHGETKARAGAMAALLGLEIDQSANGVGAYLWQAVAIGDSCLFVVRQDSLEASFPLDSASQFNNTPPLICSNPANNVRLGNSISRLNGECRPGDVILLASDALACWILQESESGGRPWETLLELRSVLEWEAWVQAQRGQRAMRNDDTTLVVVKVE